MESSPHPDAEDPTRPLLARILPTNPEDLDAFRDEALAHAHPVARLRLMRKLADASRADRPPEVFRADYRLFHLDGDLL